MHDRHADPAEMVGIADARQLQDVRRADRPADGVTSCIASPLSRALRGPPRENWMVWPELPSSLGVSPPQSSRRRVRQS
jgi:hypothetical protein